MQHYSRVTQAARSARLKSSSSISSLGRFNGNIETNQLEVYSSPQGADQGPVQHPPPPPHTKYQMEKTIPSRDHQQLYVVRTVEQAPAENLRNFKTIVEVEMKATLHSSSPHLPPWLTSAPSTHDQVPPSSLFFLHS
ncbi:hypothetical protein EPR50_G00029190 [Perca flavescens]|uniref:Uncharacterized protein n=1 Tax=Perca flavescens TaxID=8167 RepID=A0A484DJS2_PERFV|nr:hypothetical protein EPR50_G00029190 [Perca flavescens]